MRSWLVPEGSTMTSYLAERSLWKSIDEITSWLNSYCSKSHIIQPAGALLAALHSPTRVGIFIKYPSTPGAPSAAETTSPVSCETL